MGFSNPTDKILNETIQSGKQAIQLWLDQVRLVLKGAVKGASEVVAGISIVIHCSDGWDRTAQVHLFFIFFILYSYFFYFIS